MVLACGWPNHKTWKWSDTTKLMNYGLENFHKQTVGEDALALEPVRIENGQAEYVHLSVPVESRELLMKEDDVFQMDVLAPDTLPAPVEAGELVGTVVYYLNGEVMDLFPVCIQEDSPAIDYDWCLMQVLDRWIPGEQELISR